MKKNCLFFTDTTILSNIYKKENTKTYIIGYRQLKKYEQSDWSRGSV